METKAFFKGHNHLKYNMNEAYFVQNAYQVLTRYSPLTNTAIWWFEGQSVPTQAQIVSDICQQPFPPSQKFLTFHAMNHTFLLDASVKLKISGCQSITPVSGLPTQLQVCLVNAYTPKCREFFQASNTSIQLQIVAMTCETKSAADHLAQFEYFNKTKSLTSSITREIKKCYKIELSRFLQYPLAPQSISWFANQDETRQLWGINQLCSNRSLPDTDLAFVFNKLNEFVGVRPAPWSFAESCLSLRTWTFFDILSNYYSDPTNPVALQWLAIQTVGEATGAIRKLCSGSFGLADPQTKKLVPVYNATHLEQIFDAYIRFLAGVNPEHLQSVWIEVVDCNNFYTYQTPKFFIERWPEPMAFVWFTGQNSSTQKTVVDEACTLDRFNMTFYESIYNSMKRVDESVKSAIYQCRDVTEALDPNRAGVFYLALAIASSLMLGITLLYLWRYEWSNMMAQFNISLLGCLLCLVLFCILNTIIWSSVVIDAFTGEHRQLVMILQIGTQVAQSLWNVFCIMASYARSESLIEEIWPRWCKLIRIVFHVSPVFYLAPIVPIAIPMMDPWQKKVLELNEIEIKDYMRRAMDQRRNLALSIYILQAISAVWFMVLDAFFLRCFYVYILKLYGDVVIPVTPKLLIITRFGCLTSILTIFMSVVAIVKAAFEADGRDIKSKQLCSMTYLILSFCVALSFMAMKWCIHSSNKKEIGSKSSKINSNLTSMKKSNATLNMRE